MTYETDDEYEYEQYLDEDEQQFPTPTEGEFIVNAVTGQSTKYLVGSKYEHLFWKILNVGLSTYDPNPKNPGGSARGGKTFFFPSPEDYEFFHEKTLNEKIKIAWRQKRLKMAYEK